MLQKHFRADRVNCVISSIILCTNPKILPGNPTGYKSSRLSLKSKLRNFTDEDATPGCS